MLIFTYTQWRYSLNDAKLANKVVNSSNKEKGQSGSVIFSSGTGGPRDMRVCSNAYVWSVGSSARPSEYDFMDVAIPTTMISEMIEAMR